MQLQSAAKQRSAKPRNCFSSIVGEPKEKSRGYRDRCAYEAVGATEKFAPLSSRTTMLTPYPATARATASKVAARARIFYTLP